MMVYCKNEKSCPLWLPRFLIGGLLLSMGIHPSVVLAESAEKGEKVFEQYCVSCHGRTGKGDGQLAEVLNPPPANLTSEQTQAKADEELREIIENGKPGTAMASYKNDLSQSQIADILTYLRTFNR